MLCRAYDTLQYCRRQQTVKRLTQHQQCKIRIWVHHQQCKIRFGCITSRARSGLGESTAGQDQVWVHQQGKIRFGCITSKARSGLGVSPTRQDLVWTNKPALNKQLGKPLTAAAAAAASWRNRTKASAALTSSAADVIDKPLSRGRTKADTMYQNEHIL